MALQFDDSVPSWLTPTRTPGEALAMGVQAGAAIGQNILRRRAMDLEAQQHALELPMKMAAQESALKARSAETANQLVQNQTAQWLYDQKIKGANIFSERLNEAGDDPNKILNMAPTDNPFANEFLAGAKSVIVKTQDQAAIQNDIIDFRKRLSDPNLTADVRAKILALPRNQSGAPTEAQLNALGQEEKRILDLKANRPTSQMKNIAEITRLEGEASKAASAGDSSKAKDLRRQAQLLNNEVEGQKFAITGYDDQGRPIMAFGKGVGGSDATVATQSQSQQKLIKYENASELLTNLEKNLRPSDVGAQGTLGEYIVDRTLAQIAPEMADKQRIANRTALVASREGLLREISDDSRFSNADREAITKALPSSGIFESYEDAITRLRTVKEIIRNRGKVYSAAVGGAAPLWTMTDVEIAQALKAKKITQQQAVDALKRFHKKD